MTLDAAADRANAGNPRLTKEASRKERSIKARADRKAFFAAAGRLTMSVIKKIPIILIVTIVAAVVASATSFDWFMSSRGWRDLVPDIGVFSYLGAGASVGFWYVGCHWAIEKFIEKQYKWGAIWAAIASAGYIICVLGVLVATVTNTYQAKQIAKASRQEFAGLQVKHDELASKLEIYGVEYWESKLGQANGSLATQLAVAEGTYDMPDLDVKGACSQKLNFNQQRACAYANGGIDPHSGNEVVGIRAKIDDAVKGLKKAKEDQVTLDGLSDKISHFSVKQGDNTALAIGDFLKDPAKGNGVLLMLFGTFSSLFLLAGGFFMWWLMRRISGGKT